MLSKRILQQAGTVKLSGVNMTSNDSEIASNATMEVSVKLPSSVVNSGPSKKKSKSVNEVKIQLPRDAKVQNVLEALALTHATKYLTNIDLKFGKTMLKDFESLGEIAGNQEHLNLEIALRHYCVRDSLKHVLMLREYLGFSSETVDGLSEFAISTGSKFHQMGLSEVKQDKEEDKPADASNESNKNVLKVSEEEKRDLERIIKEIFVSIKSSSVSAVNTTDGNIITPCLRSLSLSAYNPVPPSYRSKGHLLYLQAVSLEGETFHITATPSGFYVNKSSASRFDPVPKDLDSDGKCQTKHTLFDLLSLHSKKLVGHVEAFEKKLKEYYPISYIKPVNSFLHKPWMTSTSPTYNGDYLRLQLDSLSFETERNFNDEFQAIKDLSSTTLQSRLDSEKLLAKIINEFTVAATQGSMSIFYDDFVAMNPDALKEEQIFLKDNIFYSFVTDVNGAFASRGGYEAAIAASNQDLRTINLLNRLGTQEIRYLLSTIVEFAGRRILAQTPVPGLLSTMGTKLVEENGENIVEDLPNDITINYGFDESTGKVITNEEFDGAIQKEIGKVFHLKTHKVDDSQITLSSQSKGIIGFDKRKYILDLANTCPLDINFVREFYDNVEPANQYPHRQTLLRPELVEKWWQHKFQKEGLDYKTAYDENKFCFNPDAYQVDGVQDQTVDEISDYLSSVVIPGIIEDYATGNITAPYNGEHVVENLHINGVNVRYLGKLVDLAKESLATQNKKYAENLNLVVDGNKEHENWEKSYLIKIEKMIKERQEEINKYIQEGKDVPKELTENIKLPEEDIRKPTKEKPFIVSKDELLPLIFAGEMEIISRSVKHILREFSRKIPVCLVPALVAFVFNLLFGISYNAEPSPEASEDLYSIKNFEFSQLTRADLLDSISKEASLRFRYELPSNWIDVHMAAPYALIRSICYQFGIQIANRNYYFSKEHLGVASNAKEKKNHLLKPLALTSFTADDITVIPRVKATEFDSIVGDELWAQGAATIEKDENIALSILSQSIAIKEDVSSALHKTVAEKYLALSTIYNSCGRLPEAVSFTRKACMIYERVCGIDSFEVLRTLSNLAVLEFSNESYVNTALVYKRIVNTVQSLNLVATHHPIVVSALSHLEQIALGIEDPRLAIEILKHLSDIIASLDGKRSLAFAYVESRIGNLYATLNIIPRALEHIAVTKDIFAEQLGINHELTAQAKQWNEGLTNLIKNKQRQKSLEEEQSKANTSGSNPQKKASHDEKANLELAGKSVDELLDFIEGGSEETSKKTKSKTKKNKNKTKNK